MKKNITQTLIAKKLERSQSFVSKRMSSNTLRGNEILILSQKLKVPASAFYDPVAQEKHLGKLYIQDNDTKSQTKKVG